MLCLQGLMLAPSQYEKVVVLPCLVDRKAFGDLARRLTFRRVAGGLVLPCCLLPQRFLLVEPLSSAAAAERSVSTAGFSAQRDPQQKRDQEGFHIQSSTQTP